MTDSSTFWTDLGTRVCAPLYFSLCHWIRQDCRKRGIRRVFFLARDGLILKRTWEALYGNDSGIEAVYLWASRRCLRVAGMREFGEQEKSFILSLKNLSPAQCLHQLGLDLPESGRPHALDWNQPMNSKREIAAFSAYLDSISGVILSAAEEERESLLAYLGSLGLLTDEPTSVGLVDLGWQGNLQAALRNLLEEAGSKVSLQGFYMGTIAPVGVADLSRTSGLYFNHSLPESPYRTVRYSRLLVEVLFAAPHPSVKRVQWKEDSFHPEYVPVNEHAEVQESLIQMQEAALETVSANRGEWEKHASRVQENGFRKLARLLREPTAQEAAILGEVKHFGGFGQALELQPLARPEAPAWALLRLRRQYRRAYWRKGFLVRLKPWQRLALAPLIIGMTLDRT